MSGTASNDLLQFAAASNANVKSQSDWANLPTRQSGFGIGIALPEEANKVLRQCAFVAAMIGQFIADNTNRNVIDDGNLAALEANFLFAIKSAVGVPNQQGLADLQNQVNGLQGALNNLTSTVHSDQATTSSLQGQLTSLNNQLSTQQAQVAAVQAHDSSQDATVSSLQSQITQFAFRQRITADINLFVDQANGNDNNTGLSSGNAFKTPQAAYNKLIAAYDLNGFDAAVLLAPGFYNTGLLIAAVPTGYGSGNTISILGTSPGSVTISTTNAHAIVVQNTGDIYIGNMTLSASGTGQEGSPAACCAVLGGSLVLAQPVIFGAASGSHILTSQGAVSLVGVSYSIQGNATSHYSSNVESFINIANTTVTMIGTPHFGQSFAICQLQSTLNASGLNFNGNATGQKFLVQFNSTINTAGAGPNLFPGDSPGIEDTATGGHYL